MCRQTTVSERANAAFFPPLSPSCLLSPPPPICVFIIFKRIPSATWTEEKPGPKIFGESQAISRASPIYPIRTDCERSNMFPLRPCSFAYASLAIAPRQRSLTPLHRGSASCIAVSLLSVTVPVSRTCDKCGFTFSRHKSFHQADDETRCRRP